MEFSVRTVAMIALGLMVVVLVFITFDQVFTDVLNDFLDPLDFGPP